MPTKYVAQISLLLSLLSVSPPFTFSADLQIETEGESLPSGVVNEPYPFFQLRGTGGTPPYTWQLGAKQLPTGLNLEPNTGRVHGKPTTAVVNQSVDIKLTDSTPGTPGIKEKQFFVSVFSDTAAKKASINAACFTDVGERAALGDLGSNWSLGPAVTTQLIRYNFNNQRASFNAKGLGVGAAFRWYADGDIDAPPNGNKKDIRRVRPECRATTISSFQNSQEKVKASATLSITPTVFASFDDSQAGNSGQGQLNVQPAVVLGFWRDLINIGVGWNMAGQNRGQMFLLMGIGTGFAF